MPILILLAMVTLSGCAGMGDRLSEFLRAGSWWKAAQAHDIRLRAQALEEQGELCMALDHWRLIESITIDPLPAQQEIRRLEKKIGDAVWVHYQEGLAKMKRGAPAAARNHFLAALRLDPSFQAARQQIKAGFSPFPLAGYHTVAGDRPASIAQKVFGSADKAFLVTWFNDLPANGKIAPQTLLILPKLEKQPAAPPPQPPAINRLHEARARFSEGDLEGALAIAQQLDGQTPAVQALIHTIHLKQALIHTEAGRIEAAGESLALVPDGFTGKPAVQSTLQAVRRRQQIDADLENARHRYADGGYQDCLDLATAVLAREPQNADARQLADDARYQLAKTMVDRRQWLKARTILEPADADHAPSMALKQTVTQQLIKRAQAHYRAGVKYFINENLQAAVKEWQKALACNPDHDKARENIANARRIMQKIENLP